VVSFFGKLESPLKWGPSRGAPVNSCAQPYDSVTRTVDLPLDVPPARMPAWSSSRGLTYFTPLSRKRRHQPGDQWANNVI